ncbi:MAG: hypothetical protein ACQKBV_02790 [Puniceicoccales bacterium]
MSVAEVQEEIKKLSPTEQDRVAGFLSVLRKMRDPNYQEELRKSREDTPTENWVSLGDMKKRLGRS